MTNPDAELTAAAEAWAKARTTANSPRYPDLLRDKINALIANGAEGGAMGFFAYVRKAPTDATPQDVQAWQAYLAELGLSQASIYSRVSRVASFYDWLRSSGTLAGDYSQNPAKLARPQAPKAYASTRTEPLSEAQVETLLQHIQSEAAQNRISAIRDYALLLFYFSTGKRRSEIIHLKWGDFTLTHAGVSITLRPPNRETHTLTLEDATLRAALVAYLKASARWQADTHRPAERDALSPLWLRHDRAAQGAQAVTSHGFVYMLKKYGQACGLGEIHLQQTRHTVARRLGEQAEGNLRDVQNTLGHHNPTTTRLYLERLSPHKPTDAQED